MHIIRCCFRLTKRHTKRSPAQAGSTTVPRRRDDGRAMRRRSDAERAAAGAAGGCAWTKLLVAAVLVALFLPGDATAVRYPLKGA